MDIGFKTDKGVTRFNNEDACYLMMNERVFIIADGVGGNSSGEIASRTATRLISQFVEDHPLPVGGEPHEVCSYFSKCISKTNEMILEIAGRFDENNGMATTTVIGYIDGATLYVFNVGDSRAYLYRGGILEQITEDHTYVNELVQKGAITKDEAKYHPDRNMITKALGADKHTEADMFVLNLKQGDIILMCTDGLYGEVSEEEIVETFCKGMNMTDTGTALVDLANLNGGGDNITIICLKIDKEDIYE